MSMWQRATEEQRQQRQQATRGQRFGAFLRDIAHGTLDPIGASGGQSWGNRYIAGLQNQPSPAPTSPSAPTPGAAGPISNFNWGARGPLMSPAQQQSLDSRLGQGLAARVAQGSDDIINRAAEHAADYANRQRAAQQQQAQQRQAAPSRRGSQTIAEGQAAQDMVEGWRGAPATIARTAQQARESMDKMFGGKEK